ncbi:hypothetical protein TSUD_63330 [Trifolium subterraneum]|uniref:RNase H type-1 domain-containing protein n=1 Tax=Trifolium subterraneum TaxID=3900 RepID=A0A2Z6MT34_TRISU|nr:hypothetical protein TSUD_63330 [Trifolium subterraneum]
MERITSNDGGSGMNLQAAVGEINRLKAKMTAMEQEKAAEKEKEREEEAELDNIQDSQPLAQALWDAQVPANFKIPQLPTFEGKTDPLEHLMAVGTQTAIIGAEEHLKCKLLSSTLKDAALRWYMNLPKNSIASYTDFHKKFIHQFTGSKHVQVTATSLFGIRQGHNENLRQYLASFNEATIQVSNPNQEMFVAAVQNGLKAGHFNESLAQKLASTMQEVMKRAECYIKGEESNAEKRSRDSREKPSSRRSPERYNRGSSQRSGCYEDKGGGRVSPIEDLEPIQIGEAPHELTNLGTHLDEGEKEKIIEILRKNVDLFAWKPSDMPEIDETIITHKLVIAPNSKPVSQRKRKVGEERRTTIDEEVHKLKETGFIEEIKYPEWLANVVLVKKSNGKWRMCVDFTDLNKACPKEPYPLPSIDRLIDGASGYKTLSFMDAYSGYNQIKMNTLDAPHTTFMSNTCNYHYTVMPFGLKNAGATYQRLMDRVFAHQIGKNLEVYIDDMVVKTTSKGEHHEDLKDILASVRKYNMRLNPAKCSFGVQAGKFLGFLLTNRGIEANPKKCQAIIDMRSPTSVKEVQQLTGRIAALSRFFSCAGEKAFHFFATLKSGERFTWSDKCEEAFQQLKVFLASPPILTRPQLGCPLYLYLDVSENSMSSALVQDIKGEERPVYFVSRIFKGAEIRYQKIEKLSLAVVTTARRLRHYFQSHKIVVKTDHSIKHVLKKPDLAGRMVAWAVELSEYDITFVPRGNIKSQLLADFILELSSPPEATNMQPRTLSVDGASNIRGSGAGVVLEGLDGVLIEQSLRFAFKASNNQAEYEALIVGMRLAKEMEVADLRAKSDSQLVTSQVSGEFQAKDPQLIKYLEQVRSLAKHFNTFELIYVPREQNARADLLSKLASTKKPGNNRTVIQETVAKPSTGDLAVWMVTRNDDWRTPII